MVQAGDSVDFLCPDASPEPYFPTTARMLRYGFVPTRWRVLNALRRTGSLVVALWRLAPHYDVVLANQHMTALPAWLTTRARGNGFYYVQAYEPELYGDSWRMALPRLLARLTYRLGLHRIVNADLYRNYRDLRANDVVEPGLDTSLFNPSNRKPRQPGKIDIGCIGRLDAWKGTKEIVEATGRLIERFPELDIVLNVAFELPHGLPDPLPSWLRQHQPHGDAQLAQFYRSNDIFVATGLVQDGGFHYPCMESLACGCVVVSNYAPGTEDNCHLIRDVNSDKIAAALVDAVEEVVRDEVPATQLDFSRYSWQNTAYRMRAIFEDAAA
jgi:glycosyltransferase involved in cell wall biosynthesis